jgi:hypothetical protein
MRHTLRKEYKEKQYKFQGSAPVTHIHVGPSMI